MEKNSIDYKKILETYIRIVAQQEGVTFIDDMPYNHSFEMRFLTEAEFNALKEAEKVALSIKIDEIVIPIYDDTKWNLEKPKTDQE